MKYYLFSFVLISAWLVVPVLAFAYSPLACVNSSGQTVPCATLYGSGQTPEEQQAASGGVSYTTGLPNTSCLSLNYNLKYGSRDRLTAGEVTRLQKLLKQLGFYKFPTITGYFGLTTRGAVRSFQRYYGLTDPGYGVVGAQTRAKIKAVTNCSVTATNNPLDIVSILLSTPNGGEVWDRGTTHRITWRTGAINSAGRQGVKLLLASPGILTNPQNASGWNSYQCIILPNGPDCLRETGIAYTSTTIINDTPNDGSYDWAIPATVSPGQYAVLIFSADGFTRDQSDAAFTIR